jgi:ribosomal protein L30E
VNGNINDMTGNLGDINDVISVGFGENFFGNVASATNLLNSYTDNLESFHKLSKTQLNEMMTGLAKSDSIDFPDALKTSIFGEKLQSLEPASKRFLLGCVGKCNSTGQFDIPIVEEDGTSNPKECCAMTLQIIATNMKAELKTNLEKFAKFTETTTTDDNGKEVTILTAKEPDETKALLLEKDVKDTIESAQQLSGEVKVVLVDPNAEQNGNINDVNGNINDMTGNLGDINDVISVGFGENFFGNVASATNLLNSYTDNLESFHKLSKTQLNEMMTGLAKSDSIDFPDALKTSIFGEKLQSLEPASKRFLLGCVGKCNSTGQFDIPIVEEDGTSNPKECCAMTLQIIATNMKAELKTNLEKFAKFTETTTTDDNGKEVTILTAKEPDETKALLLEKDVKDTIESAQQLSGEVKVVLVDPNAEQKSHETNGVVQFQHSIAVTLGLAFFSLMSSM